MNWDPLRCVVLEGEVTESRPDPVSGSSRDGCVVSCFLDEKPLWSETSHLTAQAGKDWVHGQRGPQLQLGRSFWCRWRKGRIRKRDFVRRSSPRLAQWAQRGRNDFSATVSPARR